MFAVVVFVVVVFVVVVFVVRTVRMVGMALGGVTVVTVRVGVGAGVSLRPSLLRLLRFLVENTVVLRDLRLMVMVMGRDSRHPVKRQGALLRVRVCVLVLVLVG